MIFNIRKAKLSARAVGILFTLAALILPLARPQNASAATSMVFGAGIEFMPNGLTNYNLINGVRASGFNTMVIFTMHVNANGTFIQSGQTLCSNGVYTGDPAWGGLLDQCRVAPTSVSRIEMCIGAYGDTSFANIKTRINADGTNATTELYKNLVALKNALHIDAIDYDDEQTYDSASAIAFGQMCDSAGLKVTLCPYTSSTFWKNVKAGLGGIVDFIYLQCYDGGNGNDPANWAGLLNVPVSQIIAGDWDSDGDAAYLNVLGKGARENCGGGFWWPLNSGGSPPANSAALKNYANLTSLAFQPALYWQGGAAGYNSGARWVGGAVPGSSDKAINDSGSNNGLQVNIGDPAWTVNNLWIGDAANASGALVQNGSTVNVGTANGWLRLGDSSGAAGTYTLNGGTLNCTNDLDVGESGTGVLKINGGTINLGSSGDLRVGNLGDHGTVIQTNGVVNCAGQLWVGTKNGTGTYTLSNGTLNAHNIVSIGRVGASGTFVMTGGTINQDTTGDINVGTGAGSSALFQFKGGIINCAGQFLVPADMATSTCNISGNATLNVTNGIIIGRQTGTGVLNLSSGTINKLNNSGTHLIIGGSGTGTLNQTGGSIVATANDTYLGNGAGGVGIWNLNAGTAALGKLILCETASGVGTLNLNGGSLSTSSITNSTGGTSTVAFNGGLLQASANNAAFINGTTTNKILAGGAILDSQGFGITVPVALTDGGGGGGLTKLGAGTLTLTAASTYTGGTTISNGTLALSGNGQFVASTPVRVRSGANLNVASRSDGTLTLTGGKTLTGSGSISGKLSALANSSLNPGDTIGTLTVSGNVTLAGALTMELNRTNTPNADKLVSTSGTILGGGTLTITNLGPALQSGDAFQLFNQPVSGFAAINLPNVAPYIWTNLLAVNGTIQVITPVSTTPTNITSLFDGNNLTLAWPADHIGWRLQTQTNLSETNWVDVPNSPATNSVVMPIDLNGQSVFFRLVYP